MTRLGNAHYIVPGGAAHTADSGRGPQSGHRREARAGLPPSRGEAPGDVNSKTPEQTPEGGARHRLADAVYLRLVEARELCLRAVRGLDEVARLLHRHEVFVRHSHLRWP